MTNETPEQRDRDVPGSAIADDEFQFLVTADARLGTFAHSAERGVENGSGLSVLRWVVERTIAWLHGFRRVRIRRERRDDIHEAFLGLATCLITHRHVQRLCQDL